MNVEQEIKQGVKSLVELLVNEKYDELDKMDKIGVLTAVEVEEAIIQYGEKITIPPDEAYDEMDIFKIDNPEKYREEFSVDFDLWTNNHKSDLTLSCEAFINEKAEATVTIYSIQVL